MKKFSEILEYIGSSFFWQDGRVIIVVALIAGLLLNISFEMLFVKLQKRWLKLVPYIMCFAGVAFGGILMCLPNGTGGVTQHFYLGIFMYFLSTLVATALIHILIKLLHK